MTIDIPKDWCLNMAKLDGDGEIGAGLPGHPLRGDSMRDYLEQRERTLEARVHMLTNALEAIAMMRTQGECPLAAEMRKIAIAAVAPTE